MLGLTRETGRTLHCDTPRDTLLRIFLLTAACRRGLTRDSHLQLRLQ
jgi:hypothetical protein